MQTASVSPVTSGATRISGQSPGAESHQASTETVPADVYAMYGPEPSAGHPASDADQADVGQAQTESPIPDPEPPQPEVLDAGPEQEAKPPDRIDQLFIRMQVNYGHIWSSRFGSAELMRAGKAEWGNALARCSDERLEIGVNRCFAEYDKAPSMTEFVRCCLPTPEEFGLPDSEDAYREVCCKAHNPNHPEVIANWSHPAVYLAGKATGWHDLQCGLSGVRNRFDKHYLQLCRQVMSGARLTIPQPREKALEQHQNGRSVRTEHEKRTAQSYLDQLKSQLGMRHGNTSQD
ncbi:replication protein P [Oceanospirillum sediminis]|uniref:Replication protein P n=1 Tax=Oceanospirillum sediminis TaxID=2760088 RepID=A0A839IMR9_9GAMM|nr:replication protein P [Oceanospirillum sediminis]MBB1485799.1 hypothetical protein [Oceanospirillum sediminis]